MVKDSLTLQERLWDYCNILLSEGLSYDDYAEQLAYLLFLKIAYEQTLPPYNRRPIIPLGCEWSILLTLDGEELETHYCRVLEVLKEDEGLAGTVFKGAQYKIGDPNKLKHLIDMVNEGTWFVDSNE